jgi:hypothetical protein
MTTTTDTHRPAIAETMPVYGPRKCRRCKGTGHHSNYGGDTRCFSCKGSGIEQVEVGRRPLTADEQEAHDAYMAGVARREARERARRARREARNA